MVRKPDREARDVEPELVSCPKCHQLGPEYDLECSSCMALLPMCIASGKRMVTLGKDWSQCPSCQMPCRASEMRKVVADGSPCPMCGATVDADQLIQVPNPTV